MLELNQPVKLHHKKRKGGMIKGPERKLETLREEKIEEITNKKYKTKKEKEIREGSERNLEAIRGKGTEVGKERKL